MKQISGEHCQYCNGKCLSKDFAIYGERGWQSVVGKLKYGKTVPRNKGVSKMPYKGIIIKRTKLARKRALHSLGCQKNCNSRLS